MYAKIAKTAWQVKRMGIGAVVFRAELQKVVVAVASILHKEAKRKNLSHKDLTFGVYYMLYLKHASDVSDPEAVRREHGSGEKGVEEVKTSKETLEELSFYLPLAWSQYRTLCSSSHFYHSLTYFISQNTHSRNRSTRRRTLNSRFALVNRHGETRATMATSKVSCRRKGQFHSSVLESLGKKDLRHVS